MSDVLAETDSLDEAYDLAHELQRESLPESNQPLVIRTYTEWIGEEDFENTYEILGNVARPLHDDIIVAPLSDLHYCHDYMDGG